MKVVLIDGSPKTEKSNSRYFAEELRTCLSSACRIDELRINKPYISDESIERIRQSDVLVICAPLYVDQIPAHLLYALQRIELAMTQSLKQISVYAVLNCGFFEGVQIELAMEILESWCMMSGLIWRGGIGVGGGEMLGMLTDVSLGKGPKKSLGLAMQSLAKSIESGSVHPFKAAEPDIPRSLYMTFANLGFSSQAKKNGLKKKDLFRQP